MTCPKCRSKRIIKHGTKFVFGKRRQQYRCNNCGHIFTPRGK